MIATCSIESRQLCSGSMEKAQQNDLPTIPSENFGKRNACAHRVAVPEPFRVRFKVRGRRKARKNFLILKLASMQALSRGSLPPSRFLRKNGRQRQILRSPPMLLGL